MTTHTLIFSIILPIFTWVNIIITYIYLWRTWKNIRSLKTVLKEWQEIAKTWENNYHEACLQANRWKQLYEMERLKISHNSTQHQLSIFNRLRGT